MPRERFVTVLASPCPRVREHLFVGASARDARHSKPLMEKSSLMKAIKLALILAVVASCGVQAEEVIRDSTTAKLAARGIYSRKYEVAQRALQECAHLRHVEPTERSLGNNRFELVPHPAVKHAAEVDQPVRAPGS